MNRLFFIFALFFLGLFTSQAQIFKAYIGIDGFTCSLCALSVEKSIQQLTFVEKISMNLNDNTAEVVFRNNRNISIRQLAKKVSDAGFSVRYIEALVNFGTIYIDNDSAITFDEEQYVFIKVAQQTLNGDHKILFLNKGLISKKEYTRWERWIKSSSKKKSKKAYFVTLSSR